MKYADLAVSPRRNARFLSLVEQKAFEPSASEGAVGVLTAEMGVHAPRTSRDVCRDACAIERPLPAGGHRWIVPACAVAALALFVLIAIERLP